ncbi:hypothetical protein ACHHYP_16906 [Achlya hypogyna]|uniref:C3H1-type domain-containing protein n=1 Tax=Achlya hypogyna TaxID=1202772 RepID=A0A1V9ZDQ3_ACHHY|nr:hypothetical protein ACHHYP_16906 [Achlya hypogyna]
MAKSDNKKRSADGAAKTSKKQKVEVESASSASESSSEEAEEEAEEEEAVEEEAQEEAEEGAEDGDENIDCKDCGNTFVFTAGEKAFYAEKGFDNKPVRCKDCKNAKKERMNGGGGRGGRGFGGRDGGRGRGRGGRGGRDGGRGGGRGGGVCYAFQKGECNRGDGCRFSHSG